MSFKLPKIHLFKKRGGVKGDHSPPDDISKQPNLPKFSNLTLPIVGKQHKQIWRITASVALFIMGMSSIGWALWNLLEETQIPECVYLVDEQRQLFEEELVQVADELASLEEESEGFGKAQLGLVNSSTNSVDFQGVKSSLSAFNSQSFGKIIVQIVGAVESPGVYQISSLHRIGDLIELAGGLTADADQQYLVRQFNLASRLKDEQRIYIPFKQELELQEWLAEYCQLASQQLNTSTVVSQTNSGGSVNDDGQSGASQTQGSQADEAGQQGLDYYHEDTDADVEQAETLADCISVNLASSEELQTLTGIGPATAVLIIENRPYLHITELLDVKGIGQATLEKLEPFVCL